MLRSAIFLILFLGFALPAPICWAQESGAQESGSLDPIPSSSTGANEAIVGNTEQSPSEFVVVPSQAQENFNEILSQKWREVLQASKVGNYIQLGDKVNELEKIKTEAGFESLETYSLYLVAQGLRQLQAGNREAASFYAHKALLLSPWSARVLIKSLRLVSATGSVSVWKQLLQAIQGVWYQPHVLFELGEGSIYPLLWALTFALFVGYVIFFVSHIEGMMRGIARLVPNVLKGITTPILCLALLVVPTFFGPLLPLLVWGILIVCFYPERRWLTFFSGIIFVLWASAIPIKENLSLWLANDGVRNMLRVTEDGLADREKVKELTEGRAGDGTIFYAYGQLLRRLGEYDEAEYAFLQAETLMGEQPWTRAQRGMIAYLKGESIRANGLFTDAEKLGLNTAQFLFNFSKIKFDISDTAASSDYFRRASRVNNELTMFLRNREETLGEKERKALAEIRLPLQVVWKSVLIPVPGSDEIHDGKANALVPGASPLLLGALGGFLILAFLMPQRAKKRTRSKGYYSSYRFSEILRGILAWFPGAGWIFSGRPVAGVCVIVLVSCMGMPLISWWVSGGGIFEFWPGIRAGYASVCALIVLLLCYVGYYFSED